MTRRRLPALALLAAAFGAAPLRAAISTEAVTAVTLSTTTGLRTVLSLDSQNTARIVFYDPTDAKVKYIARANGSTAWGAVEKVDSFFDHVHSTGAALGLDASRVPHVVFYDDQDKALKYTKRLGAWQPATNIDVFASSEPYVSLAMGADGNPRVLYNNTQSSTTMVGVYNGSAWSLHTVVAATMTAPGAIALDGAGRIHVAFNADDNELFVSSHVLVYAVETAAGSGVFQASTMTVLGTTNTAPGTVSLAVTAGGVPHISAFDEVDGDLWYVTGSTATPVVSTAVMAGFVGQDSSIALNTAGNPEIATWSEGLGLDLFTYVPTNPAGLRWSTTTIHASTEAGAGFSLVLNPFDHALISYFEGGAAAGLRFATEASRNLSIAGTVSDAAAAPMPGVTVALTGNVVPASVVTAAGGTYSFANLFEGSYLVAASKAGFGFQPAARSFVPLSAAQTGQDFTGGELSFTQVDNLIDPTKGEVVTMTAKVLDGRLFIGVYALNGRLVRTLMDEEKTIGTYVVTWDGKNGAGEIVASGIYLVRVEAKGIKVVKKVAVVK